MKIQKGIQYWLLFGLWCLTISCTRDPEAQAVLGGCPMNTYSDQKGEVRVKDQLPGSGVELWRTYQADFCYFDPLAGSAARGEEGVWYKVKENQSGQLMVLVEIPTRESGEIKLGWIDCRSIQFLGVEETLVLTDFEKSCQEQ